MTKHIHNWYIVGTIGTCRNPDCLERERDFTVPNRKAFPLDYERASKRPIPENLITTGGFYLQGHVDIGQDTRLENIKREIMA